MSKAIIFLNGTISKSTPVRRTIGNNDLILCADGGMRYALKYRLRPKIVIGDGDSLTPLLRRYIKRYKITWIEYPVDKDETDGELALLYVVNHGFRDIVIFGALGGRIDQTLANLNLSVEVKNPRVKLTFMDGEQNLFLVKSETSIAGSIGDTLSLVPLTSHVSGITTDGLKFQLHDNTLDFGKTKGLSNAFTKTQAKITVKSGTLLAIHRKK